MPDAGREACVVKYVKKLRRFYRGEGEGES